jgi:DNA-binding NarL/FixJ family response regulator
MMEGMSGEVIRVLVVDDHRIVREGLRAYLGLIDDIEMVGEAADGRGALDALARAKAGSGLPDVVLMDLLMEPMDGIAATAAIKERYPEVEVVAVTSFIEEDKVHAALEAGAAGICSRTLRLRRSPRRSAQRSEARCISIQQSRVSSPRRCGGGRRRTRRIF